MQTKDYSRSFLLALSTALLAVGLSGCGARSGTVQAPAGTKMGTALTAAQVQAIQQKRQGAMQQRAQGQ